MIYANIKPLRENKVDFLQQRVAASVATCGETLRLARFFFDKLFKPEINRDASRAF
jgi:hypothetical protein